MKNENSLERKLTRARTQLLLSQPFFGTLCLRLKLMKGGVPTMATDGRRILFNPEFVQSLQPEELQAVLAHEVLHCALGHHCRRGQRDPQLWNEAADLAINPLLISNGFSLPEGALVDPAFDNLSAEEIYARRLKESGSGGNFTQPQQQHPSAGGNGPPSPQQAASPQSPESGSDNQLENQPVQDGQRGPTGTEPPRPGAFGEVMDATDEDGRPASEAEKSRQRHEWNIAADQAVRSAKACGREPASIERPLTESRQSK